MGFISKQIRGRSNQQLAEPLRIVTALPLTDAVQAIKTGCETHNRRAIAELEQRQHGLRGWFNADTDADVQYYVDVQPTEVLISYQKSAAEILKATKRPGILDGHWLAKLTFPKGPPPELPGGNLLELTLLMWVTDADGKLGNKRKYEELIEFVKTAVGPPTAP